MVLFIHCLDEEDGIEILEEIKNCFIFENSRIVDEASCNLDLNIQKAMEMKHPDIDHLSNLVDVFNKKKDISILNSWKKWNNIKVINHNVGIFNMKITFS